MFSALRPQTDPDELRAIVDLEARGWTREDIMRFLGICRATYYNRKAEIRRRRDGGGYEGDRMD